LNALFLGTTTVVVHKRKEGEYTLSDYYDGTKLLSLSDLNGEKPEIFLCTTNRSGGKTTYFNRLCVNKFKKGQGKFGLLYRYNYELDDVADKFFKDIQRLFFPDNFMRAEKRMKGMYCELFLCDKDDDPKTGGVPCGYAISLNNADAIKKNSHLFSDIERMVFDEFQSETNHYCDNELTKFQSIHVSIARGNHQQSRYLPVYMISNPVTLINPYYVGLGISSRLNTETKFLKGNGFVLEQGYIESASIAQKQSGFNRAFANSDYVQYASEAVYLNDNMTFVEKPSGTGRYVATLRFKNRSYAVREYTNEGIIYCDDHADETYPVKYAVTTDDHQINFVMLKRATPFFDTMRYFFEHGCFRFKDLRCKEALMTAIAYY